MAPGAGIVNRAVGGLQGLNQNGPGWLYYGVNGADRGLGYNGSYMTLGGFIPYAEDDMGGFWAADLRGHLSEYGGFFSNVGFVRKQFLGGSLLGVGVYWDYDGDMNQYPAFGTPGTPFGQFGHSYNQVGVSAEWLTDYGNIRSNGYMPVGTTGYAIGSPSYPFYQNFVMCQYGLDTALTGTDLEIGAYVPGLSDWAGMISVGGYALGNARYDWSLGPQAGQDIVPWFGGVYTRLDMTFLENWDFSLQYNNDSYFDSTGFARLTYRMGGSRRRNVPDQMEQPMMRNEHIVRGHQTPIVAVNPNNGNAPWRVIHVDNSNTSSGTGTAENPVTTLAAASTKATNPWDIVFVHQGLSRSTTPYGGTFAFGAANQSLVGDGAPFTIDGGPYCGTENLATMTGQVPLFSNPAGTSVVATGPAAAGATIANLAITGSGVGIRATGQMTSAAGRNLAVSNVTIAGNGTSIGQTGVRLKEATGTATFSDTQISNMTQGGFVVEGGSPTVQYQGAITSDLSYNGGAANPLIYIANTTGGGIQLAVGGAPSTATVANAISDIGGTGIQIVNSQSTIDIGNVSLTGSVSTAISLLNDNSTVNIVAGSGTGIDKKSLGAAVNVDGGAPTLNYFGPISNVAVVGGTSYLLAVTDTTGGSVRLESPPGSPFTDTGNGIKISGAQGNVTVLGADIQSSGAQGIIIQDNSGGSFGFANIAISGASGAGLAILNSNGPVLLQNVGIDLANAAATGLLADTAGNISTLGTNTISTASSTDPAVSITNAGILDMSFATIASQTTSGSGGAMTFSGTTSGAFNVTSAFTVSGTKGTAADITNSTGTTVAIPP